MKQERVDIVELIRKLDESLLNGRVTDAAKFYDKAIKTSKKTKKQNYGLEHRYLIIQWFKGDYSAALRRLKSLKKKIKTVRDKKMHSQILLLESLLNSIKSTNKKLLPLFEQKINELGDSDPISGWLLLNWGLSLRDQGMWKESLEKFSRCINEYKQNPEIVSRAAVFATEMTCDLHGDDVKKWAKIAQEISPQWGGWNYLKIAQICEEIDSIRRGQYSTGISTLFKYLNETEQLDDSHVHLRIRLALTEALISIGDYNGAQRYNLEAQNIIKHIGETGLQHYQPIFELLWFDSVLDKERKNEIWAAIDRLEIILAVIAKYSRPPGSTPFWLSIGRCQLLLNRFDSALKTFEKATSEANRMGSYRLEAEGLYRQVETVWRELPESDPIDSPLKNRLLAKSTRALDLLSGGKYPELEWRLHFLRGKLYLSAGDQYPGESEMVASAAVLNSLISNISDSGMRKLYGNSENRNNALTALKPYAKDDTTIDFKSSSRNDNQVTQNAHDFDKEKDIDKLQLVLDALFEIHAAEDRETLIKRFLMHLNEILKTDRVQLILGGIRDPNPDIYRRTSSASDPDRFFDVPRQWLKDTQFSNQPLTYQRPPDEYTQESRNVVCMPLHKGEQRLGIFYVDRIERIGEFSQQELRLVKTLANTFNVTYDAINLQLKLSQLNAQFRREIIPRFANVIGESEAMIEVYSMIQRAAPADVPILVKGETGTGKDLICRTIHEVSDRRDRPFMYLDCSSIPSTLLEAELFGIEKGIATGVESRIGLLEYADGGSVLLDEVAGIPLDIQAKLLRVLQEREFEPIGSERTVKVDIRLMSTTSGNLESALKNKRMRDDFFYRISGITIELPPLRDREGDVVLLARKFLQKYNGEFNKSISGFTPELMDLMENYNWPGNVRELDHVIRKAVLFTTAKAEKLTVADTGLENVLPEKFGLKQALEELEESYVVEAYNICERNKSRAARALNISPNTVTRLLKRESDKNKNHEHEEMR